MQNEERLQKYIAASGIASRRKAEQLILDGKVKVNGNTVTQLGTKVVPGVDSVEVLGEKLESGGKKYYIMLNKPSGYITSTDDDRGRNTVMELVSDIKVRLFPVGRLDYDTEGLLIITNDGDFANKLIHPSKDMGKTYIAEVKGLPELAEIKLLQRGVDIGDHFTRPAEVELIKGNKHSSTMKITIKEGKKRQVRRMLEVIGHPVLSLKRVAIGPIMLGNLPRGKWRHLRREEIERIMR